MKKEMAIHRWLESVVKDSRWAKEPRERQVRVMVRAEGYAMVRLPGGYPFVVPAKELHPDSNSEHAND